MTTSTAGKTAALEAIGFQKGEFLNDMAEIVKGIRQNTNPTNEAWGATALSIATCIQKHTNMNGWVVIHKSNEVNAWATMAALLPLTVHGLRETTMMSKAMAKNNIEQCKKFFANMMTRRIEGRVDIQNSKVYGDFTKPMYLIQVNTGVLMDKRLTERESAFFIIHEAGHIFNQIGAIAETASLAFQSAETFSKLMNAKTEEFKAIIDLDAKRSDYKNTTVIREAVAAQDGQTAFMIYAPTKIKEYLTSFTSKDPHGSYSSNSLELAADSFAIRHGGYKEFLRVRAMFADHFTRRYYTAIVMTNILVTTTLKQILHTAMKMAIVAGATSGGLAVALIPAIIGLVLNALLTRVFGSPLKDLIMNKTVRMTNMGDYAEYIKRELADRAKEEKLSKEDVSMISEILDEAKMHLETSAAKDPIIVRFLDNLLNGSTSTQAVKDYSNAVSSLMSNQLFIQAQLLENQPS